MLDGPIDRVFLTADGDEAAAIVGGSALVTIEPDTGELRGVWVDRWTFSSASDVEDIMANAAAAGFNTVFFQIRGNADAYYHSQYEPWAKGLTGTLGQDPGWDPLEVAVASGHARRVAWWAGGRDPHAVERRDAEDRKSTRLNSSQT